MLGISNIHIKYILKSGINAKCKIQNGNYRQNINVMLSHKKGNKIVKISFSWTKLHKRHFLLIVFCMLIKLYVGFVILHVGNKRKVAN